MERNEGIDVERQIEELAVRDAERRTESERRTVRPQGESFLMRFTILTGRMTDKNSRVVKLKTVRGTEAICKMHKWNG